MALVRVIERDDDEVYAYLDHKESIDTAVDEFEEGPFTPQEYISYLQERAESENYHSLISAYDKIDEHLLAAGIEGEPWVKFWQLMAEGGGLM